MSPSPRQSYSSPRSSLRDFAEKLPFLHPQPSPRSSRDWSHDTSRRTSIGLPTPGSARNSAHGAGEGLKALYGYGFRKGHRRQLSLSSFSVRGFVFVALVLGFLIAAGSVLMLGYGYGYGHRIPLDLDDGGRIPWGQSRMRNGSEVFWWEQFDRLEGYYRGWGDMVKGDEWASEQDLKRGKGLKPVVPVVPMNGTVEGASAEPNKKKEEYKPKLIEVTTDKGVSPCHLDKKRGAFPPKLFAYDGLPRGFPAPLFGSLEELGLKGDVCYDRVNRFGPYGLGAYSNRGGLGIEMVGDTEGIDKVKKIYLKDLNFGQAQEDCIASNKYSGPRTAFVIRTWDDFEYTPYHIVTLRAIISELALMSGGRYIVHFLIHIKDDSIPIWASEDVYNEVLKRSLPAQFAGMGTLWSVAQMKVVYPPPFPASISNFAGSNVYEAYRSLHFPLQFFAERHPEFEYFWQWELDIRVTGGYLELLEQVTNWAEAQSRDHLWEKSAKFFIPSLHGNSYSAYEASVVAELATAKQKPISEPLLPALERLNISGITDGQTDDKKVDLITFSPLFDPDQTRWAFHDDITGYNNTRPPTRAALVTASRLSRRLLVTMHHETFRRKRTMFPEMFPASIALQYGYKAVYAPLPVYFDRNWPANHSDHVFNNGPVDRTEKEAKMDHGSGHFHGKGGSVFGPGEHVFRGASWYSNAQFAGYLWRRWWGRENDHGEIDWEKGDGKGRLCLPMMVLHPVKFE